MACRWMSSFYVPYSLFSTYCLLAPGFSGSKSQGPTRLSLTKPSFKQNHFQNICPNTVPFQGIRVSLQNMNLVGPNSAHNIVPKHSKLSSLKQQSFILCTNLIWAGLKQGMAHLCSRLGHVWRLRWDWRILSQMIQYRLAG